MQDQVTRIAMWSGPRNISTAMMYSFAARPDCTVWDEPFYAYFLSNVDFDHPVGDEVIAAGEPDWDKVVAACTTGPAEAREIFYQKQMTHHMLAGCDLEWLAHLKNAFLIRAPEKVLASYAKKRDTATLSDIGFVRLEEIFNKVADKRGSAPPVVDADDVLGDPRRTLTQLCAALGIAFDERMLAWPKGPKPFDGVWAKHWYNAVWQSTGFAAPDKTPATLSDEHRHVADAALPYYEKLKRYKL